MKDSEHIEQSMLVRWFRLQYKNVIMYSVPNGGLRNIRTAVKLKEEGVVAGTPDLFVMRASNGFHGLYIEMKSKKGKLSDSQKIFIEKALAEGYQAKVCYGFDEAKAVIIEYLTSII